MIKLKVYKNKITKENNKYDDDIKFNFFEYDIVLV